MKKVIVFFLSLFIFALSFGNETKYTRIASLNLSSDEMLTALLPPDKIIGLSGKINEDADMSNIPEIAKKFPKIEKNLETLLDLNPDIVIGADWIDKNFIQSIKDAGVDVFIYKTPKSYEEQKNAILELGKVVGAEEKSQLIVKEMDKRLEAVHKKIASLNLEKKPKVMLYTPFETTSAEDTSFNDLVNIIDGINPVVGSGVNSFQKISKEKVIELDPDVIIVPIWTSEVDNEKFFKYLIEDPSFADITAVKNKQVYGIPYKKISPSSQYMIGGIEEMARKVYHLED
ncbi:ABC transporter substrate-binding protein [Fusobacterium sp.]|uniref:ABC transporter substrate-binding protein n=1 Tax=Fusobacterium sp. TaxID=68766 RepID=UPI00396C66C2